MNDVLAIDVIDRLPLEIQARLESDPFFSDIPVLVFDEGDIEKMLEAKQATMTMKGNHRGVAAIILPIVADDEYPEVEFGPMTLRISVQVVEQVELNKDPQGTQKSARRVARRVRDLLKLFSLPGLTTHFVIEKNCIKPVPLPKELGQAIRVYEFACWTDEADGEALSKVCMPSFAKIEDSGPKLQLTCATDGAAIWYTTDDTFPAPDRKGSLLYTVPFAITQDVTIRAAAYLDGSIASDINRSPITVS